MQSTDTPLVEGEQADTFVKKGGEEERIHTSMRWLVYTLMAMSVVLVLIIAESELLWGIAPNLIIIVNIYY